MSSIADNLRAVRQRIDHAAQACGRAPGEVALLAVSKTFPAQAVREAHGAGQRAFGESYVQEAVDKLAALEDLRAVIGVLRADDPHAAGGGDPADAPPGGPPHTRRPQPTLADLPALVEESRAAGMPIELVDTVDAAQPVPAMAGRTAYRIVQEGLTNARKHAPGSPVTVEVSGGPGSGVSVTVSNPRRPGPAASIPGTGTGLVGLAERARLAGGHLEHTVAADGGFRVTAWLPWPE